MVCPTGPRTNGAAAPHPRTFPGMSQGSAQRAQGPLHLPLAPQAVGVWDPASTAAPPVPTGSQAAPPPLIPSCPVHTRPRAYAVVGRAGSVSL